MRFTLLTVLTLLSITARADMVNFDLLQSEVNQARGAQEKARVQGYISSSTILFMAQHGVPGLVLTDVQTIDSDENLAPSNDDAPPRPADQQIHYYYENKVVSCDVGTTNLSPMANGEKFSDYDKDQRFSIICLRIKNPVVAFTGRLTLHLEQAK